MSSFDRGKAALSAICLLLGASLSACGFRPVYGVNSATHAPAAIQQFATIEIPVLPDRAGQQLRNLLIDSLHPGGAAGTYQYRLNIRVKELDINLGLQQNSTSTRGQVRLSAEYWLVENQSGKTLLHETLRAATGYNILINQFSSVLSADDARQKSLEQIATNMTLHLALYFQNKE